MRYAYDEYDGSQVFVKLFFYFFYLYKLISETCIKVSCQTILKIVMLSCLAMVVYQQDISPALNDLNACTTVAISRHFSLHQ